MKLVECVPNFSEGKNKDVIEQIVSELRGVKVLGVEANEDYNRTVVTFVGSPGHVLDSSYNSIKKASELIDMSKHKGGHPRIGAADVCQFIPLQEITMEECILIVEDLGRKVGELGIPVYLYESAAKRKETRNLADIRKGEYESLEIKLKELHPDFGPLVFNEKVKKTGAIIIGARKFLIAYNVNLNTNDVKIANDIAKVIRESGYIKTDESGNKIRIHGLMKSVKAIGVLLEKYNLAQVSINLTDFNVVGMHDVYEEVKKQANLLGCDVKGSELVGLVPKEAILQSGLFYAQDSSLSEEGLIERAVENLGLGVLERFISKEKVIQYKISNAS
ncbi:glutamate formimidoyltransferase [Candidatus Woesearchaeota archaeon]|nr:glutamate formimidoyltransferase [Candidatus Woesearchaeota archaeon]